MKILLLSLLTLLITAAVCLPCVAQALQDESKLPARAVRDLDAAVMLSKEGKTAEAIPQIESLIKRYPGWTRPRHELSRIYYEDGKKSAAILELENAVRIDSASQAKQLYILGQLYEETSAFDKAIASYKAVVLRGPAETPLVKEAQSHCQAIKAKRDLTKETYSIQLVPFAAEINTPDEESLGKWSLDGRQLYFTRLHNGQEDIFIANRSEQNNAWNISEFPFNTPQNEGAYAITPGGKYLVFTSCNRQDGLGGCDLYISVFKSGKWTYPMNMGPGFNGSSWDAQPCFGPEGKSLFFSSNREGGFGGRDIWYMYQQSADAWSRPLNAGPGINTPANEESPYVYFDGQTIYFMRDGDGGLGGYDLYMARMGLDGKWEEAINLGAPINSGGDEGALTVHPDGKHAVITKETPDQRNDLFEFILPEKFRSPPQQEFNVFVTNKETGTPVRANLEIYKLDADHDIRLSQWGDEDGHITTTLQQATNYGLLVNSPGYLMYSANLPADTQNVRSIEVKLQPVEKAVAETIVLENIIFETGSSSFLPASAPELDKLVYTLRMYKDMKMEIRGYTDDVGDEAFNLQLSTDRARAVFQYLTEKGIAPDRLTYKGFGETHPVADNATPEGRRKNRRTECVILSN